MLARCTTFFFLIVCCLNLSHHTIRAQTIESASFAVQEKNNLAIGFISTTINYPILKRTNFNLNGGFQFIGSYFGNRGGYFAFGYKVESLFLSSKKIKFGLSASLLAGGGGGAPDKDGWLVQTSAFSQFLTFNKLNLKAGLAYTYVSSGMIQGLSPFLGLNFNMYSKKNQFKINSIYPEFGFGIYNHQKLAFIGTGLNWSSRKLAGDVSIHALANAYGGYMQSLASIGYNFKLNQFSFSPGVVVGFGGGGAASVGGGALCGVQFSSHYLINKINLGLKYQMITAPFDQFNYNALFFSVGKSLNDSTQLKLDWQPVLKVYNGKNGFGNIGIRFLGIKRSHFSLLGSTYWAFTDNRGAYAEGLFETIIKPVNSIPVYSIISAGAGAGAGINGKKESLIVGVGIGISSLSNAFPFSIEISAWKGGNIPMISTSLIYKPEFD